MDASYIGTDYDETAAARSRESVKANKQQPNWHDEVAYTPGYLYNWDMPKLRTEGLSTDERRELEAILRRSWHARSKQSTIEARILLVMGY